MKWYVALLSVSVLVLGACAQVEKQDNNTVPNAASTNVCALKQEKPIKVSGAVDVYDGMARAVKYNTLKLSEDMRQKIYTTNPNLSPKDIILNVLNSPDNGNALYNGVRALDYAILYAGAYLAETPEQASLLIMQKSAQSLAVAAVKTHGDILASEKIIRKINNLIQTEKTKLAALNAKYNLGGKLSDEEMSYKSSLEAALVQLPELRENLVNEVVTYRQLIKDDNDKLKLDGRKFFELNELDKKMSPEVYQRAAMHKRPEFESPEAKIRDYDFVAIDRYIAYNYDADKSLDINGFEQNQALYIEALEKQADKAANGLIGAIAAYQKSQNSDEAFRLKEKIYDELVSSIFVQINLMFHVVKVTTLDLDKTNREYTNLKKEVSRLKSRDLSYADKETLLDKQVLLLKLEILRERVKAERSSAIASLYFYAGYNPFGCSFYADTPAVLADTFKKGFTSDRVILLNQAYEEAQKNKEKAFQVENHHERWATGDNWLEKVVEGEKLSDDEKRWQADENTRVNESAKMSENAQEFDDEPVKEASFEFWEPKLKAKSPVPAKAMATQNEKPKVSDLILRKKNSMEKIQSHPKDRYAPYVGEEPNRRKVLQLGAYIYPKNYDNDWKRLSSTYPQLKNFEPMQQKAQVHGKMFHRLLIYSEKANLRDLCNYLRKNHEDCFLR